MPLKLFIVVILIAVSVTISQAASNVKPLAPTLKSLRVILKRMNDFSSNLKQLRTVLVEIRITKLRSKLGNVTSTASTAVAGAKACAAPPCLVTTKGPQAVVAETKVEAPKAAIPVVAAVAVATNLAVPTTIAVPRTNNLTAARSGNLSPPASNVTVEKHSNQPVAGGKKVREYSSMQKAQYKITFMNKHTKAERCSMWSCKSGMMKYKYTGDPSKLPSNEVIVVKVCGKKHYAVGLIKKPIAAMWSVCCAYNMRPGIIDNSADFTCLLAQYRAAKAGKPFDQEGDLIWTLYSDVLLNRQFDACDEKKPFPDNMWLTGQPDNASGDQACAVIKYTSNSSVESGYDDMPCLKTIYPLCEYVVP